MELSTVSSFESHEQKTLKPTKGSKRNKVGKACNECRKKKVRCDGIPPCGKCQKSGIECNFTDVSTKKGPPKEYMEQLEPRLKIVDIALQTMYKNDQRPISINDSLETALSDLSIASVSCAPYVADITSRMDRIPCSQSHVEPPQPRLNIKPEAPMRFDLIDYYLKNIHSSIPIIDISLLTNLQPPSLLLTAVYATASMFHPQEQQLGKPPGWSYYKMALSIIEIYLDTPRISTVQALLLLVKYHEHIQRPGFFWRTRSLLQLASQMASDLGIARKTVDTGFSHESEYRNRTFWALYMYEVLMSTEHGLQPFFSPNDCTAPYPEYNENDQEQSYNDIINFHWLSRVIHTQGFVLQFVRSKYDSQSFFDEQNQFRVLEDKLKYLGDQIPKIFVAPDDVNVYSINLIFNVVNILLYRPYTDNNEKYNFYCKSSAMIITEAVSLIINNHGINAFYSTIRGFQQVIYCLTVAATVQRSVKDMASTPDSFDLVQYKNTVAMLNILVSKSPVTEIDDVAAPETWETKIKQDPLLSSNASSGRSSPLDSYYTQSPDSPKISKRVSKSSLKIPSTPDSSIPYLSEQRTPGRLTRKKTGISTPSLSSLYHQQSNYYSPHPYAYSQVQSQSQPSSPTFNYDLGMPDPYQNSSRRKLNSKSSLSSIDRPNRRSHPSARRHTLTDLAPYFIDMNSPFDNSRNQYSASPNSLNTYNIPFTNQSVMMIDHSFMMDPVIPDTPNESVMRAFADQNDYNSFSPQ